MKRKRRNFIRKYILRYLERTEAIHRFYNCLQGRRARSTRASRLGLLSCSAAENERHLRFNPNKRSMDPARPPDTEQARLAVRMPIV